MEKSIVKPTTANKESIKTFNNTEVSNSNSKVSNVEKNKNHKIELDGHKLLSVSAVKSVPTFSDKELIVDLADEKLTISGQNLEVKHLDLESGILVVTGYVTAMRYSSGSTEKSFLKRLVK